MADAHKNFASSLVATAPSPATSGTSLVVTTGEGTKFPTAPFNATIWPTGANPTTANAEIVRVTAVSTDTLTITRAQEATSARTVIVGDQIVAGITAKTLTDVEGVFSGFYGDGSDGNVTISTTVTLTRDMYYDTLTISGTGVLKPAGFRVFCKTALVVQASGILAADGGSASGASAGAGVAAGSIAGSIAGSPGSTTNGSSGLSATNSYGGSSGASGSGASGAAGGARSATAPVAASGSIRSLPTASLGLLLIAAANPVAITGGAGGSSGGGDTTNSGGGSGGGGGVLVINARAVTNSGTISAIGGAGGTPPTGNCGGGGGGGGGVVIVNTSQAFTGSTPVVTGGAAGAKVGTGNNGSAGSAGNVFVNVWS